MENNKIEKELKEIKKIAKEILDEIKKKDKLDTVNEDELYEAVKKLAERRKNISPSVIQRSLKVGYARAARLLDMLKEKGVINR